MSLVLKSVATLTGPHGRLFLEHATKKKGCHHGSEWQPLLHLLTRWPWRGFEDQGQQRCNSPKGRL